jgi:hypothetical protein
MEGDDRKRKHTKVHVRLENSTRTMAESGLVIMYGPPPDCKRFEVERNYSLRKCIRPLNGESLSGHSMMIRAC